MNHELTRSDYGMTVGQAVEQYHEHCAFWDEVEEEAAFLDWQAWRSYEESKDTLFDALVRGETGRVRIAREGL